MEQTAVFDAIRNQGSQSGDQDDPSTETNADGSPAAWSVKIASMICPSDPVAKGTGTFRGASNYFANRGDQILGWSHAPGINENSMNGTGNDNFMPRGPFIARGGKDFDFIKDGTSNTLLLMEVSCGVGGSSHVNQGFVLHTADANLNNRGTNAWPSACYSKKQGKTLVVNNPAIDLLQDGTFGAGTAYPQPNTVVAGHWNHARSIFSQCFAILPPNSPRCSVVNGTGSGADYRGYSIISAGSFHTGGANVAFADASVRFASETVDWGTDGRCAKDIGDLTGSGTGGYNSQTYAGPSIYGAWGALGSAWAGDKGSL
jgi:prepilin-type processing-associated H-X9-DG protein